MIVLVSSYNRPVSETVFFLMATPLLSCCFSPRLPSRSSLTSSSGKQSRPSATTTTINVLHTILIIFTMADTTIISVNGKKKREKSDPLPWQLPRILRKKNKNKKQPLSTFAIIVHEFLFCFVFISFLFVIFRGLLCSPRFSRLLPKYCIYYPLAV